MKCLLFNASSFILGRAVGCYRIAHHLRQHGWDAEVIDFVFKWSFEQLQELVKSRMSPDLKFISISFLFTDNNRATQNK
jgi:hypothetical protein